MILNFNNNFQITVDLIRKKYHNIIEKMSMEDRK